MTYSLGSGAAPAEAPPQPEESAIDQTAFDQFRDPAAGDCNRERWSQKAVRNADTSMRP